MTVDYAQDPNKQAIKIRKRLKQFGKQTFSAHFQPTYMRNERYGAVKVAKVKVRGDKVMFYSSTDKRKKVIEVIAEDTSLQ